MDKDDYVFELATPDEIIEHYKEQVIKRGIDEMIAEFKAQQDINCTPVPQETRAHEINSGRVAADTFKKPDYRYVSLEEEQRGPSLPQRMKRGFLRLFGRGNGSN